VTYALLGTGTFIRAAEALKALEESAAAARILVARENEIFDMA